MLRLLLLILLSALSSSARLVAAEPLSLLGSSKSVSGDIVEGTVRNRISENLDGSFGSDLSLAHAARRLVALREEPGFRLRGAREVSIYAKASPAVVLIIANNSIGSGVLISRDGQILTNWHVVAGQNEVGIVFKPAVEGGQLTRKDLRPARVVKFDEVADLALVRVIEVPARTQSLALGNSSEIQIGSDVHAIGHPTGEAWTYTKGIVSQLRRGYQWSTESNRRHRADVVQTQTPINPGNSGGPPSSAKRRHDVFAMI